CLAQRWRTKYMATKEFPGVDAVKTELKLDGVVKGDISKAGEHDWIKVRLVKGQGYKMVVTGAASQMGTLEDPALQVYGADGKPTKGIIFNTFTTNSNRVRRSDEFRGFYFRGETGDYYMRFSSNNAAKTGSYTAHIRHVVKGADDYKTVGNKDPKTGLYPVPKDLTPLKDGGSITGSLNRILGTNDADSFKVNLVKGRTYTFDGTPDGSKGLPLTTGVKLELFSQDGKLLAEKNGGPTGWKTKLTFTAKESGSFALRVNGGIYPTGEYKVQMSSVGPAPKDDAAADATTKRSLTMGQVATGNIETAGDEDWIKVRLEKGKAYQFAAAGASTGNGTLDDPSLELVDAKGNRVAIPISDLGKGKNELGSFYNNKATGDYFLRVKSGDAKATGSYQVNVRQVPSGGDDGDATVADHKNYLSENETASGTIGKYDTDRYQSYLTKGREYSFTLEADSSKAAAMATNGKVSVLDENMKEVATKVVTKNGRTTVSFVAAETKYYYFEVFGTRGFVAEGDYKVALSGRAAPAPKPQSLRSVSQSLSAPAAASPAAEQVEKKVDAVVASASSAPAPTPSSKLKSVAAGLSTSGSVAGATKTGCKRKAAAAGLASA
ncbi:MAG: hypothetical protein AAF891_00565, partial [Pseudomonadota bacterium]